MGLQTAPNPLDFGVYEGAVVEAYKDIYAAKPVKPTPDSETFYTAVPAPNLVVMDVSSYSSLSRNITVISPGFPVFLFDSVERYPGH